jgi:hypothetical protein
MHWQLVTVAAVLLGFAAVSRRIEGTSITGADGLHGGGPRRRRGALWTLRPGRERRDGQAPRGSDARRRPLLGRVAHRPQGAPQRARHSHALLGIGLPLTILAGFVAALALLGDLAWPEALVLAIVLAPTDAALGQAVVTSPRLPVRIRQSLNVESGLNDGICVPLFLIALAVALAEEGRSDTDTPRSSWPRRSATAFSAESSRDRGRGRGRHAAGGVRRRDVAAGRAARRGAPRDSARRGDRGSGFIAAFVGAPSSAGCGAVEAGMSRTSSSRPGRSSQP